MALFETETCGRCGGSGQYSYNQIDGTRCYGCGGRGVRLSKRGAAAQNWYRSRFPVKTVADLKVGDVFRSHASDQWATITAINEVHDYGSSTVGVGKNAVTTFHQGVDIEHTPILGHFGKFSRSGFPLCQVVTVHPGKEEMLRLQALALQYQASLTKLGKPSRATQEILDTLPGA